MAASELVRSDSTSVVPVAVPGLRIRSALVGPARPRPWVVRPRAASAATAAEVWAAAARSAAAAGAVPRDDAVCAAAPARRAAVGRAGCATVAEGAGALLPVAAAEPETVA